MWRLWHKLFGWDYVIFPSIYDQGIARLHKDEMNRVWYWKSKVSGYRETRFITDPEKVIWLTCSPAKWGF